MRDFPGRVAVITGAASGIGRALAARCAAEKMRVVLADVEEAALSAAKRALEAAGATVLAQRTDVSDAASVEALRDRVLAEFGGAHLVCPNAGVMNQLGRLWEQPLADYEWIFGVNVYGIVHTLRAFVPALLAQDEESHIVITASMSGLSVVPGNGVYQASKHAALALAETLYHELADSRIGVSVLCPGYVRTGIGEADRNRPAHLAAEPAPAAAPVSGGWDDEMPALQATAVPAEQVADTVFRAVRERRFWILTHENALRRIRGRYEPLLEGANPRVELGV